MARRTRTHVEATAPEELRAEAHRRGWPDDLLDRALASGFEADRVWGLLHWRSGTAEDMEKQLAWHERLTCGDLQGREVRSSDNEAFCDLWARAPERIGDLEITTLRGPDGFAQFRLQENVNLQVIADGNVLVASVGWARHNALVAGRRVSLRYGQALRVHEDYRRQGFGDAVRSMANAMNVLRPSFAQYDYIRAGNIAVVGWWEKHIPGFFDDTPRQEGRAPGIPVEVTMLPARAGGGGADIRPARREDVPTCVELINGTHGEHDLFRPYSREYLEARLDEGYWGERVPWYPKVYSWQDFRVVEQRGRIVACGGLWDRGRDQRDRFRHAESGEERIVSDTALLDWGFEAGAEDAMAALLDAFQDRTHSLSRDALLAPLQQTPALARRLEAEKPALETRYLRWGVKDLPVTRPHTNLVYW